MVVASNYYTFLDIFDPNIYKMVDLKEFSFMVCYKSFRYLSVIFLRK
jgi:hypothetical protein